MKPLHSALLTVLLLFPVGKSAFAQMNAADSGRYIRTMQIISPCSIPYSSALGDSIRYRLHHVQKEREIRIKFHLWQSYARRLAQTPTRRAHADLLDTRPWVDGDHQG